MKNQKIIQAQLRMEDITVIPHCLGGRGTRTTDRE